jgi:hypothetical protein
MKILPRAFMLLVVGLVCNGVLAVPADSPATAAISCTVDDTMEWAANFADITIAAHIDTQASVVTGSGTATLYTNGNVTISADNTIAARLANSTQGTDVLVTEYRIEYDSDGITATGGSTVDYDFYDTFLAVPSAVTHVAGDGAVDVTLRVRASNRAGNMADAGTYTATQTLTASWAS